ncbi:hypothetical protein [Garciella nitratireducens]|uniref:aspartate-alanine antiporter-like transporter n=1 Tax=Garciella nitratireducens TaxID=218205 RepID=UPI0030811A47
MLDVTVWLTSPFVLMFIAVITGLLFGRIKFGRFNFGTSGALFTGIAISWFVVSYVRNIPKGTSGYDAGQKMMNAGVISNELFNLFLILFVCAVGLLAAKDMNVVLKKYGAKFIALGILITFGGAVATYGMTLLSKDSNPYEVAGVYTGSMTSSPGLAAAIEAAKDHATNKMENFNMLDSQEQVKIAKDLGISKKEIQGGNIELTEEQKSQFIINAEGGIGAGHAIAYPFGVIIVILFVNFVPTIFKIDIEKERENYRKEMEVARQSANIKEIKPVKFDLVAFAFTCFIGYTVGSINVPMGPLGNFSLGATGGVLIVALLFGYIGKFGPFTFRMDDQILGVIRELGLAFFLAIVGLKYGYVVVDSFAHSGAYLALIGIVVGLVAVIIGFIVGYYILKLNWLMLSGAICGGMTSTPGLGAAIDAAKGDEPAAGYGATYPFALLGMVIFSIILHQLPM